MIGEGAVAGKQTPKKARTNEVRPQEGLAYLDQWMSGTSKETTGGEGQSALETTMNWSPGKRLEQKRNIDALETYEDSEATSKGEEEDDEGWEEEGRREEEDGIGSLGEKDPIDAQGLGRGQ